MTTDINSNLIDNYFRLLESLSPNDKLDLIARLSKSLKSTEKEDNGSWKSLYGALMIDNSADNFVEGLKRDRDFSRKSIDI